MSFRLAAAALCLCAPCWAQSPAPPAAARSAGTSQDVPQRGGEPAVVRTVSEDESVRIEELRVRGQTRRIVVRSKLPGAPAYEIGTSTDGRDLSQDRRSEGRSLWQLFSF
ncbi:MAG: hypothetical protein MUF08_15925 [Burkholderiaceae bacterium]|jgi:hypothetical protein|nr:hypothetical protein [Burkholderiaceae bacterium]MCU0966491.1 hypothetical protein [Burkholderiaceae bacterium]